MELGGGTAPIASHEPVAGVYATTAVAEGVWVPISQITIPEEARPHTQADIDSRAISMARDGQEQNALLSKEGDRLVLVYGHGRLLSAQKNNWEKLRCDIKEGLTETQKLMLALAENNERQDASPFYTALLYSKLMAAEGLSQNRLAQKMGVDQGLISKYITVLSLAPEVREVMNRFITPLAHALVIAKLPKPEDQIPLAQECAQKDYSVRELQARIKQLLNPAGSKAKEGKQAVQDTICDCHFVFDGKEVAVKPRRFRMDKESFEEYALDIQVSLTQFVTGLKGGVYQKPEVTETV